MRHPLRWAVPLIVLFAGLLFLLRPSDVPAAPIVLADPAYKPMGGSATPSPTPSCPPGWTTVPAPRVDGNAVLKAVSARLSDDAWAVGSFSLNGDPRRRTLTLHWNGSTWTTIPSPNFGTSNNTLTGVAAVAANDVWAVGDYLTGSDYESLILHWNGSSWSQVAHPAPAGTLKHLYGVAASAANDVWVVGNYYTPSGPSQSLTLHWDGTAWTNVPSPPPGNNGVLYGVSVRSATDAWAVGWIYGTGITQALILHWDGSTWAVVPSPPEPGRSISLYSVTTLASNDAWAVGDSFDGSQVYTTYTLHWNGSVWSRVPSPNPDSTYNFLYSVAGVTANDVWAVGTTGNQGLRAHWDGTTWSSEVISFGYYFYGVSVAAPNEAWTVGQFNSQSLTQHLRDPCATPSPTPIITPSATPSATRPPSPTHTGTPPTATATRPPACIPAWQPVPYPAGSALNGVSASGPNDAWIGSTGQVLHWDGATWAALPLPTTIPQVRLGQDAASAPDNVWGMSTGGAAQWDGSAWTFHPFPTPVPTWYNPSYTFNDIAASAPDNVWMVGATFSNISEIGPYAAAHWNGSAWTVYTSPIYGSAPQAGDKESKPTGASVHSANLSKVTMTASGDMWAIGYDYWDFSSQPSGPFVVHGCCARPTVMIQFGPNDRFFDISAAATNNVWVGGQRSNGAPIALHWDGSTWTETTLPLGNVAITAIVAISPTDAWATASNVAMLHWDGSQWSIVLTATGGALAASGANDVWAVNQTTIFHWPSLAIFHDVDAASPFYPYVQTLACRAIISGYACGGLGEPCDGTNRPYYRLGAPVTRGQFSKIISNAAAFADPIPSDRQTFEDVPPTHPFWLYVETLTRRGIVSGLGCGGLGEPCVPPLNRPYFRPYNPITRSQIAKVTANAAGYADPIPSTQQTFEDVPPTHPFWLYTERLAAHPGILSGYGCGGPGEPCNPPGNRPYFRSYAQATRGQTAKIVANTFYPAGLARK